MSLDVLECPRCGTPVNGTTCRECGLNPHTAETVHCQGCGIETYKAEATEVIESSPFGTDRGLRTVYYCDDCR